MGSIVAEIADKIAGAGDGERSEFEVRGGVGADGGGILTLSTSELTVVDGDILGRIDFQAPLETGTDAIVVSASIYAEADDTFAADNNSTELVFAVGASEAAAEKMRLDHDGQLGIGTATPASKLHVEGSVQVGVDDAGHDFTLFGHAAGAALIWDASADVLIVRGATADHATTSAGRILLQTNQTAVVDNDRIGQIDFSSPAETGSDALLVSASIYAEAEDTFDASGNETALVFATGSSELAAEKMRIMNSGNVGIGVAAPASLLHVAGTVQVGVDDTGHDVTFFSDAAGAFMRWDTSADSLLVRGASADATTSTGRIVLQTALTDINDGDVLGRLDFQAPLEAGGSDGILVSASIHAESSATFSATVNSTDLVVSTATDAAVVERMRFFSDGRMATGGASAFNNGMTQFNGSIHVGLGNKTNTSTNCGHLYANSDTLVADNSARELKNNLGSDGGLAIVNGQFNSNRFSDIILTSGSGSITVISGNNKQGSPGARTYSKSGENMKLAVNDSSNSYNITITGMGASELGFGTSPSIG